MHSLFKAAFWLGCVATGALSLSPVDQLPSLVFSVWDKAQHAAGFGLLAVTGQLAYPRVRSGMVSGLLAYGALIELAQAATGWRQGDVADWVADALGIGLAMVVLHFARQLFTGSKGDAQ
ncbi:MAG: VanZ family protein [Hydrogenophaga sp.]|nr:VanZ family protein [Hydrogenophaga sp.]